MCTRFRKEDFMDLNLKGKSVVITGGTLGIGKAIAFAFLKEGCSVCVCSRNQKKYRCCHQRI